MRVVVVFESLFGNTRQIADAIAKGAQRASALVEVSCIRVGEVVGTDTDSADLLLVGGPTQFHGLASRRKRGVWLRQQDLDDGLSRTGHSLEPGVEGPTLSQWLEELPEARPGAMGAAFDTRMDRLLSGGAAPKIERRLRAHGYEIVAEPAGFIVEDMEGPLRSGELERAATWGEMRARLLSKA